MTYKNYRLIPKSFGWYSVLENDRNIGTAIDFKAGLQLIYQRELLIGIDKPLTKKDFKNEHKNTTNKS